MYKISIVESAQKSMRKTPPHYYDAIVRQIFKLADNPRPFGYIKLAGFKNTYRIRAGIYRIIYTIEDKILTVNVVKIDHRRNVYR